MGVLYANVGGVWVPVGGGVGGGSDEVFIGPNDPIGTAPTTELWYDSDAPTPVTGIGIPQAGTAGQVLTKTSATDYAVAWQTPKPSVGGVYGVSMHRGVLGSIFVLTNTVQTLVSVAMPACPAGSLLDVTWNIYANQGTVATGSAVGFASINGANSTGASIVSVIGDRVQLETYSGRATNLVLPVDTPFNLTLVAQKLAAGGAIQFQPQHTTLEAVLYRP